MADEDDWVPASGSLSEPHQIKQADFQLEDDQDFYSPLADLKDEMWVGKHYPNSHEVVLSCPGCFIPICRKVIRSLDNQYITDSVFNCTFGDALCSAEAKQLVVVCDVCNAEVGVFEVEEGLFYLFHVLPGH